MKLEEHLQRGMESVKKEYNRIEGIADITLVKRLGFIGSHAVNTVYSRGDRRLEVTYGAGHELHQGDGGGPGLRIYFTIENGSQTEVRVSAFFRFHPSFTLQDVRVLEANVENPDYAGLMRGQIRSCEKSNQQLDHVDKDHRDVAMSRAVGEFVQKVSLTLCKHHFKP